MCYVGPGCLPFSIILPCHPVSTHFHPPHSPASFNASTSPTPPTHLRLQHMSPSSLSGSLVVRRSQGTGYLGGMRFQPRPSATGFARSQRPSGGTVLSQLAARRSKPCHSRLPPIFHTDDAAQPG
ncbi:hypothetical protein LZ32DRAFT_317827 [Colletotrichum eremochloae]|nr:hypothetical protein LZ32DRAFT_317827 [Colletotrichum eremochloae]